MPETDEKMTEREWREKLRLATEVFEAFKQAAYKDKEL